MQQLTPQERNQIIDRMILLLKTANCWTICSCIHYIYNYRATIREFYNLDIPILNPIKKPWWPLTDTYSRILFLKSIKTCHK